MYTYFDLLELEPCAAVRAVLLASGGYSWTIIPVDRCAEYMAALETASVERNIRPFAEFVASCVQMQEI